MATPKRNGQASPVLRFQTGHQASSFGVEAIKVFQALVTGADMDEESAWWQAGRIVTERMLQGGDCPIASRIGPSYDARTMSGTATKPKNGKAKETAESEPFHIVVSRGIERFVAQQELSIPKAAEKYGVHPRKLDRLIKQPTPGLIGENFDKICQAFGVTRQSLLELGEPTP